MRRDGVGVWGVREGRSRAHTRPLNTVLGLLEVRERHEPGSTTAIIVGAVTAAIAAAGTAYGYHQQGVQQEKAYRYNAQIAEQQAEQARGAAKIRAEQQAEQDRRLQSAAVAGYGGSGVTLEGSPLLVLMESARQAEIDQARIAYGGEISAAGYENQRRLQGVYGQNAGAAGSTNAGISLLGSSANLLNTYYAKVPKSPAG